MSDPNQKNSRWLLPSILLGIYLFLKLQGWMYARGVADLERQLDPLRPALSTKALYDQLEITRQAMVQASEKVQQMNLPGARLLQWLSKHLPASMTLRRVQLSSDLQLRVEGTFLSGARDPELTLVEWAQQLQSACPRIRIASFAPSAETSGAWDFQLEGSR